MAVAQLPCASGQVSYETLASRATTIVQAKRVVASNQAAEEVDAGVPAGALLGRRSYKGVLVPFRPSQARVRLVTTAPIDASDAAPNVTRLNILAERRAALAALVAILPARSSDVVPGLDQIVARFGPMRRALATPTAGLPHPATFVAELQLVLHGPDDRRPAGAFPTPREATQATAPCRGPVAALLPSDAGLMKELVAEVQLESEPAGELDGARPGTARPTRREAELASHATRRPAAVKSVAMHGYAPARPPSAKLPGASVPEVLVASG